MASLALSECKRAKNHIETRLSVPDDPQIPPQDRFFPRTKLARYLTLEEVRKILSCACGLCKIHRAKLRPRTTEIYYADYIVGQASNPAGSAIALFALLVYIEHPSFIVKFMERDMRDASTLESYCKSSTFNGEMLENDIWPKFRETEMEESRQLAKKFTWTMHQFAVPTMTTQEFVRFAAKVRLPFVEETHLGSGAFGDVYSFKIWEEYRKFPSNSVRSLFGAQTKTYSAHKNAR